MFRMTLTSSQRTKTRSASFHIPFRWVYFAVVSLSLVLSSVGVRPAQAAGLPYFYNEWFTNSTNPDGVVPQDIVVGPDGALWYTEFDSGASYGVVGRISTTGAITEYTLPASMCNPPSGSPPACNSAAFAY